MRKRFIKFGCTALVVGMLVVSQMSMAFAAETAGGVVDFKAGEAKITIQGNEGQSMAEKTWKLHKLFHAENAAGGESVRYTLNQAYADSLKKVISGEINKNVDAVTEYDILDYIQTMSGTVYRDFVEEVLVQIQNDQVQGETIMVNDVTASNSVEIRGLEYGYYIIEDVTDVSDRIWRIRY